jgi:ribosomal protein L16/L10AE
MSVAQNRAARRAGNLRRRFYGPHPVDKRKAAKRLQRLKITSIGGHIRRKKTP